MHIKPDYQFFDLSPEGKVSNIGERMRLKMQAVCLPDLKDKSVLDIGCDFGFWSFLSANRGASRVLGLDRNRAVKGVGHVDLIEQNTSVAKMYGLPCIFEKINLGRQWIEYGEFDVVYLFSLYHHIFQNCGDHDAIWFWLYRHVKLSGVLIWENPLDCSDQVVRMNMSPEYQRRYTKEQILGAAKEYFTIELVGDALHEPTRQVYRFTKRRDAGCIKMRAFIADGCGGATKAFEFASNRRIDEIENILGMRPKAGSLNIRVQDAKAICRNYYRAEILDAVDRKQAFTTDAHWKPRWVRFYPMQMNGIDCYAMRFENEKYPENFLELISDTLLCNHIKDKIILCH